LQSDTDDVNIYIFGDSKNNYKARVLFIMKIDRDIIKRNYSISKAVFSLSLWLTIILGSCSDNTIDEEPFYLGGIQVNEPDHGEWVSTLKEVGMNTVSVTVYARQGIWNSDNIWWNEQEEAVISEIRAAKAEGMHVVLIPRVTLDHYFEENLFLWHGMTMPATDSLMSNWFKWYTVFVDKWAHICEMENVDVMAIGSEMRVLSATQKVTEMPALEAYYLNPRQQEEYIADRMYYADQIPPEDLWVRGKEVNYTQLEKYLQDEVAAKVKWAGVAACVDAEDPLIAINKRKELMLTKWYALIEKARSTYSGKLTYAANFDNYQNVKFWDKLDFIGINAYFKLRDYSPQIRMDSIQVELEESWDTIFKDLMDFQLKEALTQPAILTELGYVYRENSTIMPWEGFGFSIAKTGQSKDLLVWSKQTIDREERRLAVEALYRTNLKYNLLTGILYWKLTTKDYHIPYEPFVLHVQKEATDELQETLVKFIE